MPVELRMDKSMQSLAAFISTASFPLATICSGIALPISPVSVKDRRYTELLARPVLVAWELMHSQWSWKGVASAYLLARPSRSETEYSRGLSFLSGILEAPEDSVVFRSIVIVIFRCHGVTACLGRANARIPDHQPCRAQGRQHHVPSSHNLQGFQCNPDNLNLPKSLSSQP